jgi:hypothetical protein
VRKKDSRGKVLVEVYEARWRKRTTRRTINNGEYLGGGFKWIFLHMLDETERKTPKMKRV